MTGKLLLTFLCVLIIPVLAYPQELKARKFAEINENDCEVVKAWSSDFKIEIENTPGLKGYIVVYEGNDEETTIDKNGNKTIKQILPRIGELDYRINSIKVMLGFLQAPLDRIKIIKGGFRKNYAAEFWLVPKGLKAPTPTPTLKKIRYRKIKAPKKITYWDC